MTAPRANWNWSDDELPRPWDVLETNECAHCCGAVHLRVGIGWMHAQIKSRAHHTVEVTCEAAAPAKWRCPICMMLCFSRPGGVLLRHAPAQGFFCSGSQQVGTPPTPEEKAFAPYG